VIAYILLTGEDPFHGSSNHIVKNQIVNSQLDLSHPEFQSLSS
jgi:hypothetical protein